MRIHLQHGCVSNVGLGMDRKQTRWLDFLNKNAATHFLRLAQAGLNPAQILRDVVEQYPELKDHIPFLVDYFWAVFNIERTILFPVIDGWVVSKQTPSDDEKLNNYLGPIMESKRSQWGVEV